MKNKEIFLIPYAHLDTQWRWEYPTTINKYIKNTMEENIYLFNQYPDHRFNFTGALRYSMMKEYYPEQFESIKKLIEEHRWHIAGTSLDETDALVPSVESMIRNILYGDRWFKNEFETSSRDYMIPDCFGFPANMPSVLAHCGIHGFSSQKLTWNSAVGIPFELGIWKGPDGGEIVSALNPCMYTSRVFPQVQWSLRRLRRLNKLGKKNGIWKSFQYYGVGDIGGAPTENSVKGAISSINHVSKKGNGLVVRQGSADQFFQEITEDEKARMDRYTGDLLLVNHSAGTLTSATIMKRWNRKNEQLAFAAEMAAVSALWITKTPYPEDKIRSAWYRTIGNQMHDILPGTSTPTAYEYSQNDEVIALITWDSILQDSATAIAPFIKGEGNFLLFNPLGESRKDIVNIELQQWEEKQKADVIITNAEGESFPVQFNKNENGTHVLYFIPELPPASWTRFSISRLGENSYKNIEVTVEVGLENDNFVLENSYYRVKISKNGVISSIFQKHMKKELLKLPLAYEMQKEQPTQFPAWNMYWKDRKKKPFVRLERGAKVSIKEKGPLRCTIQITTFYQSSSFVKEISLTHESSIVEFTERIIWRETGCSLKLALATSLIQPEVTYNWETSRINRGINQKKLFEMPSRLWVDMSEENWGISLIEDSKYGYDHPCDDTLRMTLIYTPGLRLIQGFRDQKYQDWGEHTIRYGIYAHEGDFTGTDHLARRFNQPIRSFLINNDSSSEIKDHFSLFEVSSEQLGILAVKKPEDTDGLLIRVYERYGIDLSTEITFCFQILEVKEVNGLEEIIGDTSFVGNKVSVNIEANGIRSYLVKFEQTQKSVNIEQQGLELDYNCKLIGSNGDQQSLYPSEITPPTINAGNITFKLGTSDKNNSLRCNGQNISIPKGYNTLSILVGSTENCNTSLVWCDAEGKTIKDDECHIPSITGFIGQWDQRIWKKKPTHHLKNKRDYAWINKCIGVQPGYINRDRLEWYSTHTHKNGKDQAYQFGYMYNINLDIPKSAESLILPTDDRVHVMAITASQQFIKITNSQFLHDKFDY
ncbi:MAG: glycoside hydrolase family 38 C-terminal domain-containing protein [Promethearchaeota archaeon]